MKISHGLGIKTWVCMDMELRATGQYIIYSLPCVVEKHWQWADERIVTFHFTSIFGGRHFRALQGCYSGIPICHVCGEQIARYNLVNILYVISIAHKFCSPQPQCLSLK